MSFIPMLINNSGSSNSEIKIGAYIGDSNESQIINLGFTPSIVFVVCKEVIHDDTGEYKAIALTNNPAKATVTRLEIVENGFKSYYYSSTTVAKCSMLNYASYNYLYIAVK